MYFLNQAFYDTDSVFYGVALDSYQEDSITERITRKVVPSNKLEQLCSQESHKGFCVKEGIVFSDNNNNGYTINSEQYEFIEKAIATESRTPDLTDLVLKLLECDGCILPDFYNTERFTGQEVLAAKNLKVSKSSFNIYGLMLIDGEYETVSLYNSNEIQPKPFYIGVPAGTGMSAFSSSITYKESITINGIDTDVYHCLVPLLGYSFSVADSLINYLAFYASAYDIYRKLVESNLKTYTSNEGKVKYRARDSKRNSHKINITVKHTNDDFKEFEEAIRIAANTDKEYPITDGLSVAIFYTRSLASQFQQCSGTMQEKALKVCISLLEDIKIASLKCNLELLSIRYSYLNTLTGFSTETTFRTFKGGDVYGTTVFKRVGW